MANYNKPDFSSMTPREKCVFYRNGTKGKPHGKQNLSQHPTPANILFSLYRDKLISSVLKKHKQLSSRDLKAPQRYNPLCVNLTNTFSQKAGITLDKAYDLQLDAHDGKFDKKFIKAWLDSTEAYLNSEEYEQSKARKTS